MNYDVLISNVPVNGTEITPGYTLTIGYQMINADYIAKFFVHDIDTKKMVASGSSYVACIHQLVTQLGTIACTKAKLIH